MLESIILIILGGFCFLKWREDIAHGVKNSRWMSLSAALAAIGLIALLCALVGR